MLLTHATEFTKATNTGALVGPALVDEASIVVQRLAWSRVAPQQQLLQLAEAGQLMLLYPAPESLVLDADNYHNQHNDLHNHPHNDTSKFPNIRGFVLLDATWQLAHKMYRQSPYLQALPPLSLQSSQPSQYLLRRNQRQQGWCTAESVALLLSATGYTAAALKVSAAFQQFNQRN